jgi:hypothetical protein
VKPYAFQVGVYYTDSASRVRCQLRFLFRWLEGTACAGTRDTLGLHELDGAARRSVA